MPDNSSSSLNICQKPVRVAVVFRTKFYCYEMVSFTDNRLLFVKPACLINSFISLFINERDASRRYLRFHLAFSVFGTWNIVPFFESTYRSFDKYRERAKHLRKQKDIKYLPNRHSFIESLAKEKLLLSQPEI